jgi:hypothetical protein
MVSNIDGALIGAHTLKGRGQSLSRLHLTRYLRTANPRRLRATSGDKADDEQAEEEKWGTACVFHGLSEIKKSPGAVAGKSDDQELAANQPLETNGGRQFGLVML